VGGTFRKSMAWLHTWSGVILGALLFAIFWMGTLSVFDKEIDRWMMPDTRLALPATDVALSSVVDWVEPLVPANVRFWQAELPTMREPMVKLSYQRSNSDLWSCYLRPKNGECIVDQGTWAGSGFIFPFHYHLHLKWEYVGYWVVGLAGMAMLVLLVSGTVIHSKVIKDFFTFRVRKPLPRSCLDVHNLSGVLALPFHFIIALSGLIIFFQIYFPSTIDAVYQNDRRAFSQEVFGAYSREAAGAPGRLASIDDMAARASKLWEDDTPNFVRLWHPNDANAFVEMRRSWTHSVTMKLNLIYFDAQSGDILKSYNPKPMRTLQRFFTGLHFIQFDHWPLRWLYFALGLSGCVMIATGYIYWLETRRKRHEKLGLPGVRIVEGLTIGSVTGIVIATLAFFIANRLLPLGASFAGTERAALEVWAFYLVWLTTFAHAWLRPGRAWREQCWAIAGLALLAPVLNWITTGDHLLKTVWDGYWPVAGMDLMLLIGAGIAIYAARKLSHSRLAADEPAEQTNKRTEAINAG